MKRVVILIIACAAFASLPLFAGESFQRNATKPADSSAVESKLGDTVDISQYDVSDKLKTRYGEILLVRPNGGTFSTLLLNHKIIYQAPFEYVGLYGVYRQKKFDIVLVGVNQGGHVDEVGLSFLIIAPDGTVREVTNRNFVAISDSAVHVTTDAQQRIIVKLGLPEGEYRAESVTEPEATLDDGKLTVKTETSSIADAAEASTTSNNIGFMNEPPKELKQKFPMCDDFLKVDWISKEKLIGISTYEATFEIVNKPYQGKRLKLTTIVTLPGYGNKYPKSREFFNLLYDPSRIQRDGKLNDLFKVIKEGEFKDWPSLNFGYPGETAARYSLDGLRLGGDYAQDPVFADHSKVVCIPYPNRERALLVELRNVKHSYSDAQFNTFMKQTAKADSTILPGEQPPPEGVEEMAKGIYRREVLVNGKKYPVDPKLLRAQFGRFGVLDINHDGKDDYLGPGIYYTWEDKLYQVRLGHWKQRSGPHAYDQVYVFPPKNRICVFKNYEQPYITTDGTSYFMGHCNLTKLTSP